MIKITDGKDEFYIVEDLLEGTIDGLMIKSKSNNFDIRLIITIEGSLYTGFIKIYNGGDCVIKKYNNLSLSNDEILLSNEDYGEIKNIYVSMNSDVDIRKDAIINSMAILLCYECYQNYVLENCYEISVDQLFDENLVCIYKFKHLKNDIYKKTSELLKEKYNVEFKKLPFDG